MLTPFKTKKCLFTDFDDHVYCRSLPAAGVSEKETDVICDMSDYKLLVKQTNKKISGRE